jgi:hypothetical protein
MLDLPSDSDCIDHAPHHCTIAACKYPGQSGSYLTVSYRHGFRRQKEWWESLPKWPLKRFRHFLPERLRGTGQRSALGNALNEETLEATVTEASVIVIDETSTDDGRAKAVKGFVVDISNMSGERIVAVAVASN